MINQKNKIEIVYEDDSLIVINKPKNILVHPTTFNEDETIVGLLKDKINIKEFDDQVRPGIVQRLDKNTTGLIVNTKKKKVSDDLIAQINEDILIRKYLAIIHHNFKEDEIIIKAPIARSKGDKLKMVVSDDPKAKNAQTNIEVIKHFKDACLIECLLLTGRTHQIRVHLSYLHHPVYNDELYGQFDGYENYGQFLHSHYLRFIHPLTNQIMEFEKEPDDTFKSLIKKLESENK